MIVISEYCSVIAGLDPVHPIFLFVIAGLDPVIHLYAKTTDAGVEPAHDDESVLRCHHSQSSLPDLIRQSSIYAKMMDARVKPAHDDDERIAPPLFPQSSLPGLTRQSSV